MDREIIYDVDTKKIKMRICINDEIEKFFDDSSKPPDGIPWFTLYTGIPGAGKTTIRQQRYSRGYVVIDANEIYRNLCEKLFQPYSVFEDAIELLGSLIAERALRERRNIVVEMTGKRGEQIEQLINAFKTLGYKMRLEHVECEWHEALRRHQKKVEDDQLYISCYFTEESHERWLFEALKMLDEKVVDVKKRGNNE